MTLSTKGQAFESALFSWSSIRSVFAAAYLAGTPGLWTRPKPPNDRESGRSPTVADGGVRISIPGRKHELDS